MSYKWLKLNYRPKQINTGAQLQYLKARWYDLGYGSFISKDTYEENLNNPLQYVDPSGHYCVSVDGNWALGGICQSSSLIYGK